MAVDTSHAAKRYDRTFSVELLSEEEPATVLAVAMSDFLDAVDCATEWLQREDPARTKGSRLAIFMTAGGPREQVWAYPPDSVNGGTGEPKRLVELFGFDPVAWTPPGGEAPRHCDGRDTGAGFERSSARSGTTDCRGAA